MRVISNRKGMCMSESVRGEWLTASETKTVMAALSRVGATPRFVGGCVRDALLNRAIHDIDIAVDIDPEQSASALEAAGIRVIPTGIAHGTVTAVIDKRSFEITSLRKDIETDGRHAKVSYTKDWREDAMRRDFTMNALYADTDGNVIDVLGVSLSDLAARRVRFIGKATDRIHEDYLRILRLFRFHAWYGDGEMEPEALVACASLSGGLAGLSKERIGGEILKLMAAPKPAIAVDMMFQTGALNAVLPQITKNPDMKALESAESRIGISPSPLRRLAMLIGDTDIITAGRALRLSNDNLRALKDRIPASYPISDAASARRIGYKRGEAAGRDVLLIQAANNATSLQTRLVSLIIEGSQQTMPVKANDLMRAGMEPGPEIGQALEQMEEMWIESDFTLDRSTLMGEIGRAA